jgi:hypothetical protein
MRELKKKPEQKETLLSIYLQFYPFKDVPSLIKNILLFIHQCQGKFQIYLDKQDA